MDAKLIKILGKVYSDYTTTKWNAKTETHIYSTASLKPAELAYLQESGIDFNETVFYTHDEIVTELKNAVKNSGLTLEKCVKYFVASMDSYPRGCSVIVSFLYASKMEPHTLKPREFCDHLCVYCGTNPQLWYDKSIILYNLHEGRLWNAPIGKLLDLQEISQSDTINPTQKDWDILHNLISAISSAEAKESVSKLEKRIKSAKIFNHSHLGRIRDTLWVLSQLGVMPSSSLPPLYDQFITAQELWDIPPIGSFRSDVEPPLNGWKGAMGINQQRFNEIFGGV